MTGQGHSFGQRQVVVFRGVFAPRWRVYCPCCDEEVGRLFVHANALDAAWSHARRVHP